MIVVHTPHHRGHQPASELYDGKTVAYAETVYRVDAIISSLKEHHIGPVISPKNYGAEHIVAIHSESYLNYVQRESANCPPGDQIFPSYFITDTYAPITRGTYEASVGAVNAALTGAEILLDKQTAVYSLCRPPGHHAAHHSMGGYCYFNNAAIAAHYLSRHGKVAILDIDYHHGNGTQEAFYERDDVMYVSLHAHPATNYPYISGFASEKGSGKGFGFNLNIPLTKSTNTEQYMSQLEIACQKIKAHQPSYLVVSAGFDTYMSDPIGGMALDKSSYLSIGEVIAGLELPTLIVQEGGYDIDNLGELVTNFLRAW